jgi:hypothetical protein
VVQFWPVCGGGEVTEPTWYPVEDWSAVEVGERVRLSRVVEGRKEGVEGVVATLFHTSPGVEVASKDWYQDAGWSLRTSRPLVDPSVDADEPGFIEHTDFRSNVLADDL